MITAWWILIVLKQVPNHMNICLVNFYDYYRSMKRHSTGGAWNSIGKPHMHIYYAVTPTQYQYVTHNIVAQPLPSDPSTAFHVYNCSVVIPLLVAKSQHPCPLCACAYLLQLEIALFSWWGSGAGVVVAVGVGAVGEDTRVEEIVSVVPTQ